MTSAPAVLTMGTPPTVTISPASQSVAVGSNASFRADVSGSGPFTFQWSKDDRDLAGQNSATLLITNASNADAGSYSVRVTTSFGVGTGGPATLEVTPGSSKIINVSVRTIGGAGNETLIVGFVIAGTGNKPVLVRGIGPTLAAFRVTGAMTDPDLSLYRGSVRVAGNDNWGDSPDIDLINRAASATGAFAIGARSLDAVIYSVLQTGSYSAQVIGRNGSGVALLELYDAQKDLPARLTNVSARSLVGQADGVLIAGFVIDGNIPKKVLVRGIGPTLGAFGVSGTLNDPQLVVNQNNVLIASNDDWWRDNGAQTLPPVFASVGAFALVSGTKDAALVTTLQPGAYTATVSGADGGTGVALVEVYELP